MANRIVESARGVLNQFLPDIYIYTDHMKGVNSGKWVSLHTSDMLGFRYFITSASTDIELLTAVSLSADKVTSTDVYPVCHISLS